MVDKVASVSGTFDPTVNEGDCVKKRGEIGTILFGDTVRQLANATGMVTMIISSRIVSAGDIICSIDETANCADTGIIAPLAGRTRKAKPRKKAATKKAKSKAGKSKAATPKKESGKKAASKKKPSKKTTGKNGKAAKKGVAKKRGT